MCGVGRQPGWQVERRLGGGSAEGKQKGAPLPSKMPVSEESELGWASQQQGLDGVGRLHSPGSYTYHAGVRRMRANPKPML